MRKADVLDFVTGRTLGGRAAAFWWRADELGSLAIRPLAQVPVLALEGLQAGPAAVPPPLMVSRAPAHELQHFSLTETHDHAR
ncbi:MAG TPA: hypothetical protein PLE19_17790 [Planctomycetota bacterium]|nr:hypothetical protein [Planctomycetota bacterium]HRR80878.1 hypothetical protein [Planctomycetota bacterium]HRT96092.1 hypothetical protein [Planctomycetota bacterium]